MRKSSRCVCGHHEADPSDALRALVEHIVQSPDFLYRFDGSPSRGTALGNESFALASRLSFLIWRSIPDDELLDAAAAGELSTPRGLSAQVKRLLQDNKSRRSTADFARQWLSLDEVAAVQKDSNQAPWFTPEVARRLASHAQASFDAAVWVRSETFSDLLTGTFSALDVGLKEHFEVSSEPARQGLLMHPAFLARAARANGSAPVKRGLFVLEKLLCTVPTPPPDDANTAPPPPDEARTTREVFEAHLTQPSCRSCHAAFDPFGMALENYDGLGRYRDTENGAPINARATFDLDGGRIVVDGARELGLALAGSPEARGCYLKQWFRYAFGRDVHEDDACTINAMDEGLRAAGLLGVIEALAQQEHLPMRETE